MIFQDSSPDDYLGSRTRPASYGRSSSWSDQNTRPGVNTIQVFSEISTTTTPKADWATVSTWRVVSQSPVYQGTTILNSNTTIILTFQSGQLCSGEKEDLRLSNFINHDQLSLKPEFESVTFVYLKQKSQISIRIHML